MQNKIFFGVLSVLFSILGWIWTTTFAKLNEVEKALVDVKIEMMRIQSTMITETRVKELIRHELFDKTNGKKLSDCIKGAD